MMQQVARAVLDDKDRMRAAAAAVANPPAAGQLAAGAAGCARSLQALLAARESALAATVSRRHRLGQALENFGCASLLLGQYPTFMSSSEPGW